MLQLGLCRGPHKGAGWHLWVWFDHLWWACMAQGSSRVRACTAGRPLLCRGSSGCSGGWVHGLGKQLAVDRPGAAAGAGRQPRTYAVVTTHGAALWLCHSTLVVPLPLLLLLLLLLLRSDLQ